MRVRQEAAAKNRGLRLAGPERDVADLLSETVHQRLLPPHLELVPQLNEVYELQLAFYESQLLDDVELIRNGAYFARVGDTLTRHFLMCSGEPVRLPKHSSSRLRSFFQTNQFKTGYATHGLFPYRGKFHPQMIKGLLNVMGLKPGDIVLDPMMGSGTVLIEARLMGINSIGIDASPFCTFMTQVKLDALTLPLAPVRTALENSRAVFEHFRTSLGQPSQGRKMRSASKSAQSLFEIVEDVQQSSIFETALPRECEPHGVQDFLLLAYLDSAGYLERSSRKNPYDQFVAILERYVFVVEKIQHVLVGVEDDLGEATPLVGDACHMPVEDGSIDGILFSPPYSFAIDYLDNDAFHLESLGVDVEQLRKSMIGLRGGSLAEKFQFYKDDMQSVISECARVLRPGGVCTIVVGTNNNQLSKILGVTPSEVQRIDDLLLELAEAHGLGHMRTLERQISGMANTMRTEAILMLRRR